MFFSNPKSSQAVQEDPEQNEGKRRKKSSVTGLFGRLRKKSDETTSQDQTSPISSTHEKVIPVATPNKVQLPSPTPPASGRISPKEQVVKSSALRRDDVKHLFAGAPHFMLEQGQHGKYFPQILFPNDSDLDIADLLDRRFLRHESFALGTLHAHIPIPDAHTYRSKIGHDALTTDHDRWNRPPFDVGVFEIPNMLGCEGRELGTVGMRHFLELSVADALTTKPGRVYGSQKPKSHGEKLAGHECVQHLSHGEGYALIGKYAPMQDRKTTIHGGPKTWKKVGIRDVNMKTIADRFQEISRTHEELVSEGMKASAFDKDTCHNLYNFIFSQLLYLPKTMNQQDPYSLKVQIEALVKVLTIPGVWIDFRLIEWRLRLGQILFSISGVIGDHDIQAEPDAERNWLHLQILLAIELVIRLDAALRIGMVDTMKEKIVTPHEMHHFNRLRNGKVDWDLILARRFLDHVQVRSVGNRSRSLDLIQRPNSSLFSKIRNRLSVQDIEPTLETMDCLFVPRRAHVQLEGLLRFARAIDWPDIEKLEESMKSRFESSSSSTTPPASAYSTPLQSPLASPQSVRSGYFGALKRSDKAQAVTRNKISHLHRATGSQLGGWVSRLWLSGLVLPGETISHLLICSLLENDREVVDKIGDSALLRGGFVLDGRSFWSKSCIVGRVVATYEAGAECMGWVSSPKVTPVDRLGTPLANGWVGIEVQDAPQLRGFPRVQDGQKMAEESSFLGSGVGTVMATEFIMPLDHALDALPRATVQFENLRLIPQSWQAKDRTEDSAEHLKAVLSFKVTVPECKTPLMVEMLLKFDVYFIAAHPCRPPYGRVTSKSESNQLNHHPDHQSHEHLPSHPLHSTYTYELKSITDILRDSPSGPPNPSAPIKGYSGPWVVDARGGPTEDLFVRSWCAKVGRHALVARVGKSCLSCCVREARALEVAIIIRVGEEGKRSDE